MSDELQGFVHIQLLVNGEGAEFWVPKREYHKSKLASLAADLGKKLEAAA